MNKEYSGVSWYAKNLLAALFELDRTNQYILFYNSRKPVKLPVFDFPNVSWRSWHYPNKLFNLSLNFLSWPKLDKLIGGCDVFFSPNLHFIATSKNCRTVITVHDLSFLIYPEFFTLKQRLWHKLILQKMILQRTDRIITDSENTQRDLKDLLGIAGGKAVVGLLGINDNYFPIKDEIVLAAVREKYNLPEKFLLFLGANEPRKNLIGVLKAFTEISGDINLVIAGAGGWKNEAIKKLAQNNQRVKLVGYIDEIDKPAVYSLAKCLVYPSFYEGFGLPILEAMACGCPVICGNNSSQGEVIGDAGLLVDPYKVNEIAEAMKIMVNNESVRQVLAKKGLARAKEFSWSKTAKKLLEVFEK